MKFESAILPLRYHEESTSFSIRKPQCPQEAICNSRNEIVKCIDPTYFIKNQLKQNGVGDFRFKVKNNLAHFN